MKYGKLLFLGALFLALGSHSVFAAPGLKKTIAVADFENKAGIASFAIMGNAMADMLTDSLMQSGKFIVLERQALDAVVAEQNLAASDRSAKAGAGAKLGNIKKSQILVQGAVTEFEESKAGGGQGIGLYGVRVGSKSQKAHVAVIIRLIDTTTTEVLASQRVEGEAKSGGLSFSAAVSGVDFGQDSFSKTPMGKATQMAIDQAVEFISGKMQDVAWKGKVIKTETDGNILINAGQTAGMQAGTVLKVSRPGEPVLDPDTGMELGAELTELGSIKIAEVLEKYSKAKAEQPLKQPAQAGDVLEIVAA